MRPSFLQIFWRSQRPCDGKQTAVNGSSRFVAGSREGQLFSFDHLINRNKLNDLLRSTLST